MARRTIALLPSEVRDIRTYCLSSNSKSDLMFWTILIVSIKLFLRIEEALSMKVEDFLMDLATTSKFRVKSLMTSIKGKRDKIRVHLQIWDDEICPEFSAVRAILIWISVSGITSGFLFPQESMLKNEKPVLKCERALSYQSYLTKLKKITTNVLGKTIDKSSEIIVGTHAGRRTALLFAVWWFLGESRRAELNDSILVATLSNDLRNEQCLGDIKSDMRHQSGNSTKTYLSDSATLYELVMNSSPNITKEKVGRYQPIYVATVEQARNIIRNNQPLSLCELANWYITMVLKIKDIHSMTIAAIYDIACQTYLSKSDLSESHKFLYDRLGKAGYETFVSMESYVKEEKDFAEKPMKKCTEKPTIPPEYVIVPKYLREDFNKRRDRTDKMNIAVEICRNVTEQVKNGKKLSINGVRCPSYTQIYQYGRLVDCLRTCYRGNVDRFVQHHSKFTLKGFKCLKGVKHVYNFKSS